MDDKVGVSLMVPRVWKPKVFAVNKYTALQKVCGQLTSTPICAYSKIFSIDMEVAPLSLLL